MTVIVGFTERATSGRLFNSAAVLSAGAIVGVYRKVYPGDRTVIQAGDQLPMFHHRSTPFGIIICNDLWYLEPARVIAAAGAALLFVPTNGGHVRELSDSFRARGENLPIARAVENTTTVVVADIAGHQADRMSYGFSAIIDPDCAVLAKAEAFTEALLIADVETERRPFHPRGWDGNRNSAVTDAFLRVIQRNDRVASLHLRSHAR